MKKKRPRTYTLTSEQDSVWVRAFVDAKDGGASDAKADKAAFEAVAKRWPAVREYDKLAAGVRGEGTH